MLQPASSYCSYPVSCSSTQTTGHLFGTQTTTFWTNRRRLPPTWCLHHSWWTLMVIRTHRTCSAWCLDVRLARVSSWCPTLLLGQEVSTEPVRLHEEANQLFISPLAVCHSVHFSVYVGLLGYGLGDSSIRLWFQAGERDFPRLHNVQIGSGTHQVSSV